VVEGWDFEIGRCGRCVNGLEILGLLLCLRDLRLTRSSASP
jgi:hypothetical protein